MSSADVELVSARDARALSNAPKRPLALRLASFFFLTSLLLVTVGSAIFYWGTISALQYADDQVALKRLEAVANLLEADELNEAMIIHEISEDNQGPRQIFIRIVAPIERFRLETAGMERIVPAALFPDVTKTPLHHVEHVTLTTKYGSTFRALASRVPITAKPDAGEAIIQVATDTSLDDASIDILRRILIAVLGSAVPLCAAASWLLVRRELQPLERITRAAETIDGTTLDKRLSVDGLPDELHRLATQFNLMLSRLDQTCAGLKDYADNIAHELRTPLSRMRLRLELAQRQQPSKDEYQASLASSVEDCESLTRLLQQLLFLSRADHRQASVTFKPVSLAQVFDTVFDYFEAAAESQGVTLSRQAALDVMVPGDRDLIQRAIANLVSNALDHTPAGATITMSARLEGGDVIVTIANTGPGIALEHLAHVFDRFYRAGAPTSVQADCEVPHLGLGLAITKSIVEMHGGRITVESRPGHTTAFHMRFPPAPAQSFTGATA